MKKLNKQGFSMIELLVVLLIIGILAAVAAPLFLANSTKAKVSEAVAGAGSIRAAERNYAAQNNGSYFAVSTSAGATYFGTQTGNQSSVLGIQIHGNKYFSPDAYSVVTGNGLSWQGGNISGVTSPIDFVITVTGSSSVALTSTDTDGAANNAEVAGFIVQMDNSGQTLYTANGTSTTPTWSKF